MNFEAIAHKILNQTDLAIAGKNHRIVEIEFYYYNPRHPDPFAHRHPLQLSENRWYFHRQGNNYRGGTFKGIDLTFGDEQTYGGILLRSLEKCDGSLINGSCTCVNYILAQTGYQSVAELDGAIARNSAWNPHTPLFLQSADCRSRPVFVTARVGLSLKRARSHPQMPAYLLQPYRYLTAPKTISKGKIYLVLALSLQGMAIEEIHQLTGCPQSTIQRYFQAYQQGSEQADMTPYFGKPLTAKDICQLHAIAKKSQNLSQISD